MGYYYETILTGCEKVDDIGHAIDRAGKEYHHTEDWTTRDNTGRSAIDRIDAALIACADYIRELEALLNTPPTSGEEGR